MGDRPTGASILRCARCRGKSSALPKVRNDEAELFKLLDSVLVLLEGVPVVWATDLNHRGPALLIALLFGHARTCCIYLNARCITRPRSTEVTAKPTRKTPLS